MKHVTICLYFFFYACVLHAQTTPCLDNCAPLSLMDYQPGMRFYFAPDPVKEASNTELPDFKQFKPCSSETKVKPVLYRHLANRTLRLDKMLPFPTPNSKPKTFQTYHLYLKDTCGAEYVYASIVDLRLLNVLSNSTGLYVLPGAIYVDELDRARQQLVGKTMYSLFAIGGKKFTPVRITGIDPGASETPLRVHFRTADGEDSTVAAVWCGTNVRQSFAATFQLSRFFRCDNPKGNSNDGTWNAIQQGKIVLHMTREEVELAVGKPLKITEVLSAGGKSVDYTYATSKVTFENNKVVKVENTL